MAAAMACHGSHRGIPREPTLYSTADHGRPWLPVTVAMGAHGRPRDPTGRPRDVMAVTTVGLTVFIPSGSRGFPVATPTEPKWEPTRHLMAARVGAHVAAHIAAHMGAHGSHLWEAVASHVACHVAGLMATHVACRMQGIKKHENRTQGVRGNKVSRLCYIPFFGG